MRRHSLAATLVLVVLAAAPLALAQGKPKKKGARPAPSASAPPTEEAPPPPPPAPEPSEAPSESAASPEPVPPPAPTTDSTDTIELPGQTYYFVGARYRGNVIPQFLMNMFVNDGGTVYSNSVGFEVDIRKDGHSTIPWITYANYDTGNMLFFEKNKPDDPANYSVVQSRLGAVYLGLDEMWSTPLDEAHHWDFEYGFGVGIGAVFGNLYNNWAYVDPNGAYGASNGNHYAMCPGPGSTLPAGAAQFQPGGENPCSPAAHNNSQDTKTGGYQEKNWFNGGSVPVIFPHIALPVLSVRYKPVKEFEARFGLGFSLTGFWFGISGDYGLEKPEDAEGGAKKASGQPALHGML